MIEYTIIAYQKNYIPLWFEDSVGLLDRSFAAAFNKGYCNPYMALASSKSDADVFGLVAYGNTNDESDVFFDLYTDKVWSHDYLKKMRELILEADDVFRDAKNSCQQSGSMVSMPQAEIHSLAVRLFAQTRKINSLNQNTHPQCTTKLEKTMLDWIKSTAALKPFILEHTENGLIEILLTAQRLTRLNQLRKDILLYFKKIHHIYPNTDFNSETSDNKISELLHSILSRGNIMARASDDENIESEPLQLDDLANEYQNYQQNMKFRVNLQRELQGFMEVDQRYLKKERILNQVNAPQKIKHIVHILSELAVSRLDGHGCLFFLLYWQVKLLQELSVRYGVSFDQFKSYRETDILKLCREGIILDNGTIMERGMTWSAIFDTDSPLIARVLYGHNALKNLTIKHILDLHQEHLSQKKIKGTVASLGEDRSVTTIVGYAYIIDTSFATIFTETLDNFPKDGILVATQTLPNLLPIMMKSKAIIADEGGLAGHAAITSREFGIPCIVGAKVATMLIGSGDKIELNMKTGEVRILEKAL